MATKVKLMKLIEEVRGYAQITNRRPAPRPPVLYLMELRAHTAQTPKRRLDVSSESRENQTVPAPIKITHVSVDESPLPIVFG